MKLIHILLALAIVNLFVTACKKEKQNVYSSGSSNDSDSVKVNEPTGSGTNTKYKFSGVHCVGEVISFSHDNPQAKKFLWNFGDGTTSTDASPKHVYAAAGVYKISLRVNDEHDATGIDTIAISSDPIYTKHLCQNRTWDLFIDNVMYGTVDSIGTINHAITYLDKLSMYVDMHSPTGIFIRDTLTYDPKNTSGNIVRFANKHKDYPSPSSYFYIVFLDYYISEDSIRLHRHIPITSKSLGYVRKAISAK